MSFNFILGIYKWTLSNATANSNANANAKASYNNVIRVSHMPFLQQ